MRDMTKPFICQAIITKYIGPSNVRGSRVKATASAGSVTLHWDDALNSYGNHAAAAKALVKKLKWSGRYVQGGMPQNGYCFVSAEGALAFIAIESVSEWPKER